MKKVLIAVVIAMGIFSCQQQRVFLEGKYTLHRVDEFGQIWDTLIVEPVNEQASNMYRLTKVAGVLRRKLDDTVMLPLRRVEEPAIVVTYHSKEKILKDEFTGMVYSVNLQAGTMSDGKLTFSKVQ